jgi:hypothetical protein
MNTKTTLGIILTMLGIIGVVYSAAVLTATPAHNNNLFITAIVGLVAFIAGITTIRTTQDA